LTTGNYVITVQLRRNPTLKDVLAKNTFLDTKDVLDMVRSGQMKIPSPRPLSNFVETEDLPRSQQKKIDNYRTDKAMVELANFAKQYERETMQIVPVSSEDEMPVLTQLSPDGTIASFSIVNGRAERVENPRAFDFFKVVELRYELTFTLPGNEKIIRKSYLFF